MTAGTLADVDPLAVVNAHLLSHPGVAAELAKFDPPGSIKGVVGPPYPCLRAQETPGGSLRDAVWVIEGEILLEAWDDEANSHGTAKLRRLLLVAITAVKELEGKPVTKADAVVTHVSAGAPQPLADPSGQMRYFAPVTLTMHPPYDVDA